MAQDLNKARDLAEVGQYDAARLCYEWILFTTSDPRIQQEALLGKAQTFKMQENYSAGLETLKQARLFGIPDSLQAAIAYEQILLRYVNREYEALLSQAQFLQAKLNPSSFKNEVVLLQTLSLLQLARWDEARAMGSKYLAQHKRVSATSLQEWNNLIDQAAQGYKSAKTAEWLSTFIPGSGQIYAGHWKEGASSFILNGLGIGVAVFAAVQSYYVSAWLLTAVVVKRVFLGGREQAGRLTDTKNRLKMNEHLQPVFDFLFRMSPST